MIVSEKRLLANRRNAQLSTGPRNAEGKKIVSQNAISHGLTSEKTVVLPGEDPAEFEANAQSVFDDIKPIGAVQKTLTERLAHIGWKLKRVAAAEALVFEEFARHAELYDKHQVSGKKKIADPNETDMLVARYDTTDAAFDRLHLYEQRLDRMFHNTLRVLKKLQKEDREGDGKEENSSESTRPVDLKNQTHSQTEASTSAPVERVAEGARVATSDVPSQKPQINWKNQTHFNPKFGMKNPMQKGDLKNQSHLKPVLSTPGLPVR